MSERRAVQVLCDQLCEFYSSYILLGYLVYVYTNLTNTNLLNVRASWRLRIVATWHDCTDQEKWVERYKRIQKKHPGILAKELGGKRLPIPSWQNRWSTLDDVLHSKRGMFRTGPDQHIFTSCNATTEAYK